MIALVIVLYLLALAGCVWLGFASIKLFIRGFQRAFAPTFVPTFGVDGPTMPSPAQEPVTRPDIPAWTGSLVQAHLATCATCRASYVNHTLTMLEPATIERMLRVIEQEDALARKVD